MKVKGKYSPGYLLVSILLIMLLFSCKNSEPAGFESKVKTYGRLPYDAPLDAVKWTDGFWLDYMERLRNIYIPGTVDGSFLDLGNGSSLRNFTRAAGMEEGGALGRRWTDGDCYYLLDVVSRMYGYKPDEYLKSKLDYWIPIFAKIQHKDGLLDTWTDLGGFDKESAKTWSKFERRNANAPFYGFFHYNMHHLYASAYTNKRISGDTVFIGIADKALLHYVDEAEKPDSVRQRGFDIGGHIAIACGLKYSLTGDERYLNILKKTFAGKVPPLGPPLRDAKEIFGHNTHAAEYLIAATSLFRFTGDTMVINSLRRLADNLLSSKIFITGAVAPVHEGHRPEMKINGVTYPGARIVEGIGEAYDLPNERAYCESCGQGMFMDWFYRMFLLTGEARYMDAAERILYNSLAGCVDINKPGFFYANPQEQMPYSDRRYEDKPETRWNLDHYTWTRTYTKLCACCPPKVLRGLALTNEIAYSVSEEGLWVNLYGTNTYKTRLSSGASVKCEQSADYPWEGKVKLAISETDSKKPFTLFLRIPGWAGEQVSIRLNGKIVEEAATGGTYYQINRRWKNGDIVEMDLPMQVKRMIADPRVKDNLGKIAVMRGPVVYCLEDTDIPEGCKFDSLYISAISDLTPAHSDEMGGVVKLTGKMVYRTGVNGLFDTGKTFRTENGLYQETNLTQEIKPGGKDRLVEVSLIPFYARLNREGRYFRVWIPVHN